MDEKMKDRLMHSPEQVADLLGISRTTVYELMKTGELHRIHIGRCCRISAAELERFVVERDRQPSSRVGKRHRGSRSAQQPALFGTDSYPQSAD